MRTPFLTHESTMRVKNKPKLAKKSAESKLYHSGEGRNLVVGVIKAWISAFAGMERRG